MMTERITNCPAGMATIESRLPPRGNPEPLPDGLHLHLSIAKRHYPNRNEKYDDLRSVRRASGASFYGKRCGAVSGAVGDRFGDHGPQECTGKPHPFAAVMPPGVRATGDELQPVADPRAGEPLRATHQDIARAAPEALVCRTSSVRTNMGVPRDCAWRAAYSRGERSTNPRA